ncbi:MAG: hypothetical protein JW953_11460 [Anaerolineae bacterium]|nr:hypothetical protein [Anaerolineae bacterium]
MDDAGKVIVVWVDNYEAWGDNRKPRPRTVTIPADAPSPQVTKHYYANGQRIATRVDDDLYYVLGDHLGSTSLVVDDSGAEVGHVIYDAYGQVVENTLPEGLTDWLFTGYDWDNWPVRRPAINKLTPVSTTPTWASSPNPTAWCPSRATPLRR